MKVSTDQITVTVAPLVEPVTLAEAKLHLRGPDSLDDELVSALIVAAREFVEFYTARSFVQRTSRADLFWFADVFILPGRPIASVTNIKYYNTASPNVLTTLDSGVYSLVNDIIRRNEGETFESTANRADAVQITFVSGYAPNSASPIDHAANVPQAVKQAMLLIIGDLYENREGKIVGFTQSANPAVLMLLNPYRVFL